MRLFSLSYIKLLFCSKTEKEFFLKIKNLLGYSPRSIEYYKKAFTHKSAHTIENGKRICNERLEYLGDTVLDSIIADYVFHAFPQESEGFLTKIKSRIVNRKSLNKIANVLHLDAFIICNIPQIRSNDAMGNAFEALVGAIYLDKGYNFTKKFISSKILTKQFDLDFLARVDFNYKSQLLETIQKNKDKIEFNTIELSKKTQHNFHTTIYINNAEIADAKGNTKKESEQAASHNALDNLGIS